MPPKCTQVFTCSLIMCAKVFGFTHQLASFILPFPFLLQSEMTKTEGVILAHLIKKASIRAHFSAVALSLTCEEDFSIPRSLVIESIINKRYFLPEDAVARLVAYFTS